jgi:FKBP-type peptidyl-prolyl cis-trans isomerase
MRIPTLALLLALAATSAVAAETPAAKPAAAPAAKPADADKALNAVGLSIAKSLEPLALSPADLEKVLSGIKEGLSGKPKQALDDKAQENLRTFVQGRMAAAAEKEKVRGAAYLETAAKEKGAVKTANGAIVVSLKEGTGASPAATDKVKVHYTGTLVDGKVFDSSRERNQPAEFPLNGVIPCWTEAMQKLKVGGRAKIVCPSAAAYGERGSPPVIPGNAVLTFDVELLDITKPPPPAPADATKPATPATPAK